MQLLLATGFTRKSIYEVTMAFTIAHISDAHLSPLPQMRRRDLLSKRITGYANWRRGRHRVHTRPTLDLITADIAQQKPDHLAVTGDLVNLGLQAEFDAAREWLETLGTPENVTVCPGNHDTYTPNAARYCIESWRYYMRSDLNETAQTPSQHTQRRTKRVTWKSEKRALFPGLRIRHNIALVNLSSGMPTVPFSAAGALGKEQRLALTHLLDAVAQQDLFVVVLIHHPPLQGLASRRRGLKDVRYLQELLVQHGCHLVLYGHNHKSRITPFHTSAGQAFAIGVPSASSSTPDHPPLAAYNLFKVQRSDTGWGCKMIQRGLREPDGDVSELSTQNLTF